ncbi:MAG: 1,4-dihydroxy-2-naphthoate polyprenyltransferase [Bacillaceae bacterium]
MQIQQQTIQKQSLWKMWWNLLRPHTLTAAIIPVLIGTVYAWQTEQQFSFGLFIAMLTASLLIQIATNNFNEYFDYKRGLDNEDSIGIGGSIVRDGMKPKTILYFSYGCLLVALLIGVYICNETSWWLAAIGLVSMAVGYLYTGGPYPIAYTPFGEIIAGGFMGVLIIGISFYIQTLSLHTDVVILSIPTSLLIGAILLANNIRDLDNDKENGRKTLAILIGKEKAIFVLATFFFLAYISATIFSIIGLVSPLVNICYLSLPLAIRAVKTFKENDTPLTMMPAMASTAKLCTIHGFLFALGMIISLYLN